jgi:hypothetical protein
MAKNRFIKFMDSEESDYLLKHQPNAFLLLTLIAKRARRCNGSLDGFEVGDALLGDYSECGLTRKKYRVALQKLEELKLIEILKKSKNGRTCQKRAIKRAIKGTLVSLRDSRIWDINSDNKGHQSGQPGAIKGPSKGHEQECKNDKNEKKEHSLPAIASKKKSSFSPEALHTAKEMVSILTKAKSDYLPTKIEIIARALDLMVRIDKRSFTRILEITSWALGDNFWRGNILKPNPCTFLRKHYDQLDEKASMKSPSLIFESFLHGECYSGYDFYLAGDKISFVRATGTSYKEYALRLNDINFEQKFLALINSLNIEKP